MIIGLFDLLFLNKFKKERLLETKWPYVQIPTGVPKADGNFE